MIGLSIAASLLADIPFRKKSQDNFPFIFLHTLSYSVLFFLIYIPLRLLFDESPAELLPSLALVSLVFFPLIGIIHFTIDFCFRLLHNRISNGALNLFTFVVLQLCHISVVSFFAARM